MTIMTRKTNTDDVSRITPLLDQLGYPSDTADVANRMGYWLDDPSSELIIAENDATVVGLAAVHVIPLIERTARRARLVALVVDSRSRRLGVGRVLLEAAEEHARTLGCLDMEITSSRDRDAAHSFYADMGYEDLCSRSARYMKKLSSTDSRHSLGTSS